ncbi:hypothetical protein IW261DRAFT_1423904 [Armillaria novae-zelandiae]|uniref:Uncharacterized protein n=1 Tax=Armillaria novae-zelandiae TaxID=153914 RepID=A0AA39NW03_9AGAR|nr:hypothetical protein IW261DRAFT_1423904 [Armillaria novae-zelandiae]
MDFLTPPKADQANISTVASIPVRRGMTIVTSIPVRLKEWPIAMAGVRETFEGPSAGLRFEGCPNMCDDRTGGGVVDVSLGMNGYEAVHFLMQHLGLMLMWDEAHQSSKVLDRLHRKIDRLEEAIEVLLGDENHTVHTDCKFSDKLNTVKGTRMAFGIGKVYSLSISLNRTKKSIRSGSRYLTSRAKQRNDSRISLPWLMWHRQPAAPLVDIDRNSPWETGFILTTGRLQMRMNLHRLSSTFPDDEPIVHGEVHARTPLFELSDDEEDKATVQLRSQQTPFSSRKRALLQQ